MSNIDVLTFPFTGFSTFQSMTQGQRLQLKNSWIWYQAVELYDSNISTMRANGDSNAQYYQFTTQDEKKWHREGHTLAGFYFGYSNTVEKN